MLTSMVNTMGKAREGMYCIPALAAANETALRAVIEAAEEKNSPLIILQMYCDDILGYGKIATELADKASVPVSIILDHGAKYEHAMMAIRAGFTDVMLDKSSEPYEVNCSEIQQVVKVAHAVGVGVEAEFGHVGSGDRYDDAANTVFTRPDEAVRFVSESGCDTLAVSVGTSHGVYKGEPKINFDLLSELHDEVSVPLVIHGGSGTGDDNIRRMCKIGANKLNIAHELYEGSYNAVMAADMTGFHTYGFFDVVKQGYKDIALRMFDITGAAGHAAD